MAEFPALPLFTDAYLADTRHLTTEEHGAYLLLLMCAWRTRGCALKDDNRALARIVGVGTVRWRRLRPVLADFFDIDGGLWRQKKLTAVYEGVQERVAKNRANGAKGGRVRAALRAARQPAPATASGGGGGDGAGENVPTRLQNQKPEPKPVAEVDPVARAVQAAAAAAGLDGDCCDTSPVSGWLEAGADLDADILPVLVRLGSRELARAGQRPGHLNYYSKAVLEARDRRLGALKAGAAHAASRPAPPPKRAFDRDSADDWRQFLGDADSRFRGDYISRNWHIGPGHPHFLPAELGPDPREALNPDIPTEIRARYGPLWRWRRD